MKTQIVYLSLIVSLLLANCPANANPSTQGVAWQSWSPDIFTKAKAQNKPILLNLEAVWCHWCHVMDAKTYVEPGVVELLNEDYIAVKVDHDARPDLANRYRKYGWPATIVFHPEGHEIAKRAGYIEAASMIKMLTALKSTDSKSSADKPAEQALENHLGRLSEELKQTLKERHRNASDKKLGGLRTSQKYLEGDSIEYALLLASLGDEEEAERAKKTLSAATALIDPVWGGAYQYSTGGVWSQPHYEKLMRTQARYLRIYAKAFEQFNQPSYLSAIGNIRRYLNTFLVSPEGAFFVSQDADVNLDINSKEYFAKTDVERRKLGIPRVDRHIYADANGLAIEGLAAVYRATRNLEVLKEAQTALEYVEQHLVNPQGYFQHTQTDTVGVYLSDNLAMARAYLELFKATRHQPYLDDSVRMATLIHQTFQFTMAGYASGTDNGTPVKPVPQIDENISLGRFGAELHKFSSANVGKQLAERALAYLAAPAIATKRYTEEGILLLDDKLFPENEKNLSLGASSL